MKYLERIIDKQLRLRLEAFGAVQIVGPKWCGVNHLTLTTKNLTMEQ